MSVTDDIYVGTLVKSTVTFSNAAGTVTDPTTVTFKVKAPDGTETPHPYTGSGQPTKDGVGIYSLDVLTSQSGNYFVRAIGTGTVVVTTETWWGVEPSEFTSQ